MLTNGKTEQENDRDSTNETTQGNLKTKITSRTLTINLNYWDNLIEKWKTRHVLTKTEKEDLKYILKRSEICKKCRGLNNQITENKIEYSQNHGLNYWLKVCMGLGASIIIFNFYIGIFLLTLSVLSYVYVKKSGWIVLCLNCGTSDSFVKINKYLKK